MTLLPHTWQDWSAAATMLTFLCGLIFACARHIKNWLEHLVAGIIKELQPNGGSSLRDAMDKTARNVETLTQNVATINATMRERSEAMEHLDSQVDTMEAKIDQGQAQQSQRLDTLEITMQEHHAETKEAVSAIDKRLSSLERRRRKVAPPELRAALSEPEKQAATKNELRSNLKGRGR